MQKPTMRKAAARPRKATNHLGAPKQTRPYKGPEQHYTADDLRRHFKTGFLLGLAIGLLACAAVIWLWAVPTVDGAVEASRHALEASQAVMRA